MAIHGWFPEREVLWNLQRMHQELDRLWESALQGAQELGYTSGAFPPVNISELADRYILRTEIPGINPSELEVTVSGNTVSIKGQRQEEKKGDYHRQEREVGSFSRAIGLPGPAEADRAEAEYSQGVLKVTLPKRQEEKAKTLRVKAG